ncbi:MAG TPA: hypothetical protein PLN56_09735 [Methanoregulaceae archaeon]|jgi:hypothetical protein|nr:hypothetical protein [Methanoregulaceae archaeon]
MAGITIETDLEGKINNIPSFKKEALLPLFEAIVNSVHAIEDREELGKGTIKVNIIRANDIETSLGDHIDDDALAKSDQEKKIVGFEIEDNGVGFNDDNFKSFNTADSTYKLHRGGKGVGRFLWLKAFDKVEIESIYGQNGTKRLRKFEFSKKKWVIRKSNDLFESDEDLRTQVKLIGFKEEYRREPSAYKTTRKIAQRILEHCLSYYIGEVAPTIIVSDGRESYNLDELYSKIRKDSCREVISLHGEDFCIDHLKLFETNNKVHNVVLCADKRDVEPYSLHSLLGTSALYEIGDDGEKFYYSAYVSSDYLDRHVNMTRRSFDLPLDGDLHNLDGTCTISLNTIKNAVIERTKVYLATYLEALQEKKASRVSTIVSSYPTLRSVPQYCPEIFDEIEPNSSEEKIYEVLYKHKGTAEYAIQLEAERLLKTQVKSVREIEDKYKQISEKIVSFKRDDLASVICKRKLILELFEKKLELNREGKYENEEIIHDILFPRRTTTDEITYKDHNLWIIDELLTFHRFAASDKDMKGYSSSESQQRADIIVFAEADNDGVSRAVSIIELKKPYRERYERDPVDQIIDTIEGIQNHEIKSRGRPIILDKSTKFYCYAICDITTEIKRMVKKMDMIELKDNLGYYRYHKEYNAYIEIIAYDRLTADAKKRNAIFFDALGINRQLIDWDQ